MSRFHSNYQINKTDRQLNEETLLDTSKYKNDLRSAINSENHRINVDSAKKKAVFQRMDYDGFHQMVLGADLKGIKSKDMMNLKSNESILNNVMIQKKLNDEIDFNKGNFVVNQDNKEKENSKKLENIITNNELRENYKIFKKNWKVKNNTEDKICLLYELKEYKLYGDMINSDTIEADIFIDYLYNMGLYTLREDYLHGDKDKKLFLLFCIKAIVDSQCFTNLNKFLGKKQKSVYKEFNEKKKEILNEDESLLQVLDSFINKLI